MRVSLFTIVCIILTVCAVLLIGANIVTIVFRGIHSLPECVFSQETQFAIRLSMKTACISTAFCFGLAIPTAYILTRPGKKMLGPLEVLLELTMSLPNIVLGLSMLIIFSSVIGSSLKGMGFPVIFNPNGIILAQLVINLPFAIKLSATAFRGIDRKLEHVAGLLGAGPGMRFFTILLPLSRNALISAVILVWSRALGEFGATLMLVGVTRLKTETLPASIYLNVSTNNLGAALASAFILLMISAASLAIATVLTHNNGKRSRYV